MFQLLFIHKYAIPLLWKDSLITYFHGVRLAGIVHMYDPQFANYFLILQDNSAYLNAQTKRMECVNSLNINGKQHLWKAYKLGSLAHSFESRRI